MKVAEVKAIKPGDVLHCGWGYDQTQYDFCKVLENTGKTINCQMIGAKTIKDTPGGREVVPDASKTSGEPFRLRITESKKEKDYAWICGSYPYVWSNPQAKRHDCFYLTKPGEKFIETER